MPRYTDWKRIIGSELVDELERWECEAPDRVIQALVDGMGARRRYDSDPLFHRAICAIAQIATSAIFDKPLVTEDERRARVEDFRITTEDETEYLLGSPANAQRLLEALDRSRSMESSG